LFILFFLVVLGFELGASHLLDRHSTLEPLHQPFFVMDFFQIGSGELFAWADFEQRSSCSLPPEKGRMTGVSHWLAWLSALYFNVEL
jgi:hypothetical protein